MQFLLWLRKSKLNKAGTAPVYLRIFLDTDTRSEYATGIRCRPEEWNAAKGRLRGNDEATRLVNKKLKKLSAKAELKADRLQDAVDEDESLPAVMPADVAAALRPKPAKAPATCLLLMLRDAIPLYSTKATTRANAGHALGWLAKWPPSGALVLADLTAEVATHYVQWLSQQDLGVSSKRAYLRTLAGLVAAAAADHPRVFARLGRLLGTPAEAVRRVLPLDWQAQLLALRLPRRQSQARDAFLLAYFLHGSRIGAVLELQWSHVDWAQMRVRFTTHKHPVNMDIKLVPQLGELLERYRGQPGCFVLPWLPAYYLTLCPEGRRAAMHTAAGGVWQALKNVSKKLGWPALNPHLARHTLALRAYENNDKDLRVPQQLLGHKHLSTTAGYIASLTTTELDSGAANAYG